MIPDVLLFPDGAIGIEADGGDKDLHASVTVIMTPVEVSGLIDHLTKALARSANRRKR